MKKWKKSGRKRKKLKTCLVNLIYTPEEYFKINKYRIEHNYSWKKLASIALKNAVKMHKESEKKCVT